MMENTNPFTLLIVDDEEDIRLAMKRFFARSPYHLLFAEDGMNALDCLNQNHVDLILLDLKMPGMNGLDVLDEILEMKRDIKVIMLTGQGGVQDAVTAIKSGATDFVEKSASPDLLEEKIAHVYQSWQINNESRQLREQLAGDFQFDELIGESPPMLKLKGMIARLGPSDASILIQGRSGTGKELVALAIHAHSSRKSGVFIPVDCAAINETVIESELFGHSKGAFTGAEQSTLGLIRSADKGTLFLDEVGELSLSMQVKLLRTIQERTVRPVGSIRSIPVDIRIVAATNRNLVEAVAIGAFRQDLYYRLSAITLHLPPLRERSDDIIPLAYHFIEKLSLKGETKVLSNKTAFMLRSYDWPGNVRELSNIIQCAMALSVTDIIMPTDLSGLPQSLYELDETAAESGSLADYEKLAIRSALDQTSGSRRSAAKLLSISEATLYRRIRQYGL
jgi:DNA-binding NtrC family response regulator